MKKLNEVINILRDYEADCRDGFVSSTESWVESRCIESGIFDLKDEITGLILKSFYI